MTPLAESSPLLKAGPKGPISVYISLPQYLSLFFFFDVDVLILVLNFHRINFCSKEEIMSKLEMNDSHCHVSLETKLNCHYT